MKRWILVRVETGIVEQFEFAWEAVEALERDKLESDEPYYIQYGMVYLCFRDRSHSFRNTSDYKVYATLTEVNIRG